MASVKPPVETAPARRRRAHGEASRTRILDAATEVASERGYEGTSISLVSKKCGLPASSIYWHFTDKDDLIAAVIERSFATWSAAWQIPDGDSPRARITALARQVATALLESPDFIRLGLMLALERRPVEPRARTMFLDVREQTQRQIAETLKAFAPTLKKADLQRLSTYAVAGADGLFIAYEIGGGDLVAMFELHGQMLYDAAVRLASG